MQPFRALFASLLVISSTTLAATGPCRSLEYAEIKDMSTKELVKQFCYHKHMQEILSPTKMEQAHECQEQRGKIVDALKRRGFKFTGMGGSGTCGDKDTDK